MATRRSLPKMTENTEAELRAFYVGCGLSAEIVDRAIKARSGPVEISKHGHRPSHPAAKKPSGRKPRLQKEK